MLNTTGIKHGLRTRKMEIVETRTKPYPVDKLNVDVGNWWPQSFGTCSGTERSSVILDIALSFATEISKFKSVLLLIDWGSTYFFDDLNIKKYLDYLQSTQAHFQTIFVSHNPRPKLDWSGWAIAKMIYDKGEINVKQNEK